jgi:hypothetical protein
MKTPTRAALLAATLAIALTADAQQARQNALEPLQFLSGRWVSKTPAGIQEEDWSPIIGGSMTGSFRVVQDGKPVFYEFWAVELDAAGGDKAQPVLELKHFNAGLMGWEEKNVCTKMPLISSSENDAVFAEADGSVSLHYRRTGNTLTCTVHHVRNGKGSDETFTLTRAPAS